MFNEVDTGPFIIKYYELTGDVGGNPQDATIGPDNDDEIWELIGLTTQNGDQSYANGDTNQPSAYFGLTGKIDTLGGANQTFRVGYSTQLRLGTPTDWEQTADELYDLLDLKKPLYLTSKSKLIVRIGTGAGVIANTKVRTVYAAIRVFK